ncbi:MAG: NADH-quinone oxidoreductase subunit NuoE [Thermodesulfobacteriota bacterium]|nr:MAG: NADH-quinone oxidoreductase subunit NuoE [Thermodesulfobacteriota bacterium]
MLTEKVKEEIRERIKKYHNRRSAVMDALMIVQRDSGGYISRENMEDVAGMLGMQPVEVSAVAAFYTMYNYKRPAGKYHIQVCRNITCSLLGAEHLIEHMEKVLGVTTGHTTKDSMFTLSTVECLGSCGTAPMMQINDDYYENLTVEGIDEILKGLK